MARLYTKGNNFMRQLGQGDKAKELSWNPVSLVGHHDIETEPRLVKVSANQGQTCVMTEDGRYPMTQVEYSCGDGILTAGLW